MDLGLPSSLLGKRIQFGIHGEFLPLQFNLLKVPDEREPLMLPRPVLVFAVASRFVFGRGRWRRRSWSEPGGRSAVAVAPVEVGVVRGYFAPGPVQEDGRMQHQTGEGGRGGKGGRDEM